MIDFQDLMQLEHKTFCQAIHDRYYDLLLGIARKKVSPHDAADVVQNVFVYASEKLHLQLLAGQFDSEPHLRRYLAKSVLNGIRLLGRQRACRHTRTFTEARLDEAAIADHFAEHSLDSHDTEDSHRLSYLTSFLDDRDILILNAKRDGIPLARLQDVLAKDLSLSIPHPRVILQRATKRIRDTLLDISPNAFNPERCPLTDLRILEPALRANVDKLPPCGLLEKVTALGLSVLYPTLDAFAWQQAFGGVRADYFANALICAEQASLILRICLQREWFALAIHLRSLAFVEFVHALHRTRTRSVSVLTTRPDIRSQLEMIFGSLDSPSIHPAPAPWWPEPTTDDIEPVLSLLLELFPKTCGVLRLFG